MRKLIYIICLPALLFAVSCTKTYSDYGNTSTVKMSNGWWVTYFIGGVAQNSTPLFFSTYNSSSNLDSMWVDDLNNAFGIKCKTKVNYTNLTFSATKSGNEYMTDSLTVTNGKVLLKAGHSRAGNPTDSLYMQLTFSDDPSNTVVTITGTARTGLIEDDY